MEESEVALYGWWVVFCNYELKINRNVSIFM